MISHHRSASPLSMISESFMSSSAHAVNQFLNVQIFIPVFNIQRCVQVNLDDTVWSVKQSLLSDLPQDLPEGFNYGLFLPPCNGRAGKFLLEDRPFRDYPFQDCVPYLELKYKKRVYKTFNLDKKLFKQLHSKSSLNKFCAYAVERKDARKIEQMCESGLDPNFHNAQGETPLVLAASIEENKEVIMALVAGGAHLDFRNLKGETPMHKAVLNTSRTNAKILLDLGASTQSREKTGLTPLYYLVSRPNTNPDVAELVLRDYAETGVADSQGNQEIHQACKNGLTAHLEHLLFYGADSDCQNYLGNTPLHVCAYNDQISCAKVLLFRNADVTITNNFGQTPYHVAISMGHMEIAHLIATHDPVNAVPYRSQPRYNSKRRLTWSRAFLTRGARRGSLSLFDQSEYAAPNLIGSAHHTLRPPIPWRVIPENGEQDQQQRHSSSVESLTSGHSTMNHRAKMNLCKTMSHELMNHQTMNHHHQKMIHHDTNGRNFASSSPKSTTANGQHQYQSQTLRLPSANRRFSQPVHFDRTELDNKTLTRKREPENDVRKIVIPRGPDGFGFVLRGAKSLGDHLAFQPNADTPSLQFFEKIDSRGMAYKAGLKAGDFLLEINGIDVRCWNHDDVVQLIASCDELITLKVITVDNIEQSIYGTLRMHDKGSNSRPTILPPSQRLTLSDAIVSCSKYENRANSIEKARNTEMDPTVHDTLLPIAFRDPKNKVASIRNRNSTARRISVTEIAQFFTEKKDSVQKNDHCPSTSSATGHNNVPMVTSPKVYASVAEMKRLKVTKSKSPTSSLSSIGDAIQESALMVSSNRPSSTMSSFSVNMSQSKAKVNHKASSSLLTNKKHSMRPKTPPPPPPVARDFSPYNEKFAEHSYIVEEFTADPSASPMSINPAEQQHQQRSSSSPVIYAVPECNVKINGDDNNAQDQQNFSSSNITCELMTNENSTPMTNGHLYMDNERSSVDIVARQEDIVDDEPADFASDLRNALAKRRRQINVQNKLELMSARKAKVFASNGENAHGICAFQDIVVRRRSLSSCEGGETTSPSTSGPSFSYSPPVPNNDDNYSVSAPKKDSGYTSSRNSLEKSECCESSTCCNNNSYDSGESTSSTYEHQPPEISLRDNEQLLLSSRDNRELSRDQISASASPPLLVVDKMSEKRDNGDQTKNDAGSSQQSNYSLADKPVSSWTVDDVSHWLDSLYLSEYRRNFERRSVTGAQLMRFGRAEFAQVGVTRIAHRLAIENALKLHKRFHKN